MNCDGSSRRPVPMSLRVEDRPDEDLTYFSDGEGSSSHPILPSLTSTVQTWRTAARSLKSKGSVPGHFAPLKIEWFKAEL